MKANEKQAQSANANNNVNNESNVTVNVQATATDATATPATDEKVVKAIEQKRSDILKDCFKEIAITEIQKSTIERFSAFGKFTAIYRPSDKKENGKFGKSGGKTIYNFETPTTIYMGYTSSELAAVFNLPKREYKSDESDKSDNPIITELRKLQKFIGGLSEEAVIEFCSEFADKLDHEIKGYILADKIESEFNKTFAAVIPLFDIISESKFAEKHGEENLKIALALGYKFSDTKSDKENESNESK